MKNNLITILKAVIFIGISLYLSFKFNDSLANLVAKTPIGWVKGSILLRLLISFSFARSAQLLLNSFSLKFNSVLTLFIGAVIGFGISFGLQPIYNTDYGNWKTENMILDITQFQENCSTHTLQNEAELYLFLSTNCPHCKNVSRKMGYLQKQGKVPSVNAIFTGTSDDANAFLMDNDGQNFKLHFIENDSVFGSFSGGRYPSIYLLDKNQNTAGHWFGGALNYSGLDLIESIHK